MWTALQRGFAILLLAVVAVGCRAQLTTVPETASPNNVIFVLVDTLRADHMSAHGYHRDTTPFLDLLAQSAVVFEHARSQAGCTFPSVNSIMTSRYPFDFVQQGTGEMGIPEAYPTLAEILGARGYRTVAVSASPIVRATPSKENPSAGFDRGFDVFDETCLWGSAACVNKRALNLLDRIEEPFFLYLHYMDPHGHYKTPRSYEHRFAGAYDGYDFIAAGDANPIADMLFNDGPVFDITDRDIQHLVDLYDDEIRYFDEQFETLVTRLRDDGLFDQSIIVFTSDHGEEFLEHGQVGHCRGVWETLTRVPLFIKVPGMNGGRRVDDAVQLVDILPTLLALLGIENTGSGLEGVSLRSLFEGDEPLREYAYADQGKYRSVDDGRWHLILDGAESTATLFDLRTDPLEQRDLYSSNHNELNRLSEELNLWLDVTGQSLSFDEAVAANMAKVEELRALGYLR